MKIMGHKTESVYRRYAIVSDSDMREAAVRIGSLSPAKPEADEIPDEVWRILTDETPGEGADVINTAYSGVAVGEGVL